MTSGIRLSFLRWVLPLVFLVQAPQAWASPDCRGVKVFPAAHYGYNHLVRYYDGSKSLGAMGGDLFIASLRKPPGRAECRDQIMFRLTVDYEPIRVPSGNNGLSEEWLQVTFGGLMRLGAPMMEEVETVSPYFGFGIGPRFDRLKLNTPATGSVAKTLTFFDVSASLGLFGPRILPFIRPYTEARLHGTLGPNGMALNAEYVAGILFNSADSPQESRRPPRRSEPTPPTPPPAPTTPPTPPPPAPPPSSDAAAVEELLRQ